MFLVIIDVVYSIILDEVRKVTREVYSDFIKEMWGKLIVKSPIFFDIFWFLYYNMYVLYFDTKFYDG